MARLSTALTLFLVFTAPAIAQSPQENTYGHATAEEATAAINREQAELARKQLDANAASQRAHDEAVTQGEAQHRQQLEAYEAEKARLAKEYDQAMERWRADVAACKAGDRTRCAKD